MNSEGDSMKTFANGAKSYIITFIVFFILMLHTSSYAVETSNRLTVTIINNSGIDLNLADIQPGQYTQITQMPNEQLPSGGSITVSAQTTAPKSFLSVNLTFSFTNKTTGQKGQTRVVLNDPPYAANMTPIIQISSNDPNFESTIIKSQGGNSSNPWNLELRSATLQIEPKK